MNIQPHITLAGAALISRLTIEGRPLTFLSARLGAGRLLNQSAEALTQLIDERARATIADCAFVGGLYRVHVQIESKDVGEELYIWEMGLYADDGEGGEVLACYVAFSDAPDWLPPESVAQYVRDYEIGIAVGIENAEMVVSPATLIRREEFLRHAEDAGNPHAVTPEQIGAAPSEHEHFGIAAAHLESARTIALSGGATGEATAFDGSCDITIPITALDASAVSEGTLSADRLSADEVMLRRAFWMESGTAEVAYTDILAQGTFTSTVVIPFRKAPPTTIGQKVVVFVETRTRDVARLKIYATALASADNGGFTVALANLGTTTMAAGVYYINYLAICA